MIEPKISVIIPFYNVKAYVNRCLESIVGQTYKNLEIICVDDGSSDGTSAILDEWAKKDDRINVIHKPNGGVSSARNTGLDAATGDYIGFVDGDDYLDHSMYETLYSALRKYNADIASCSYYQGNDNNWKKGIGSDISFACDREEAVRKCLEMKHIFPSACLNIYSKLIVDGLRFRTDLKISEDRLFNYHAIANCNKYYHSEKCLYYYVERSTSAIHTRTAIHSDSLRSQNIIMEDVNNRFPQYADYSERICIIESINYIYGNAKVKNYDVADSTTQSLKRFKKTYMKNTHLKCVFKLLVLLSFVNKRFFYMVLCALFDLFIRRG